MPVIQMVREGQRARRQQQAATVSMMPASLFIYLFPPLPTIYHQWDFLSLPLTLYAFALSWLYECFWTTVNFSSGVFDCPLVWFGLKLGHHTPLPAIHSLCLKLHNAKCLGPEGIQDKAFQFHGTNVSASREMTVTRLCPLQAWYTSHVASSGNGWSSTLVSASILHTP